MSEDKYTFSAYMGRLAFNGLSANEAVDFMLDHNIADAKEVIKTCVKALAKANGKSSTFMAVGEIVGQVSKELEEQERNK